MRDLVTIPIRRVLYIIYIDPIIAPPLAPSPPHLKQLQEVAWFCFL
jgi:hypothetical protein